MLPQLGVLRALVAGRPVADGADPDGALANLAETLRAARYGVAVWSGGTMEEIEVEALCGLISDLNAKTRWAGLPLPAPGNADGVARALGWKTGFPVRVGFGRGRAEHDPWRLDAARMVESGEADAAVWVQAIEPGPPPWERRIPLVAVTAQDAAVCRAAGGGDHRGAAGRGPRRGSVQRRGRRTRGRPRRKAARRADRRQRPRRLEAALRERAASC